LVDILDGLDTVQQQSRSTIEYIVSKIGERHERAKSNARKIWKALTDFTDPDFVLNDQHQRQHQHQQASWQKTESGRS
jgi:hypothetical protein